MQNLSPFELYEEVRYKQHDIILKSFSEDEIESWKEEPITNYLLNYISANTFEILDCIATSHKDNCEFDKGVHSALTDVLTFVKELAGEKV